VIRNSSEVKIHVFWILVIDEGESSVSPSGCFIPETSELTSKRQILVSKDDKPLSYSLKSVIVVPDNIPHI